MFMNTCESIWSHKLEYHSSDLKMVAAGSSVFLKKFYLLQQKDMQFVVAVCVIQCNGVMKDMVFKLEVFRIFFLF